MIPAALPSSRPQLDGDYYRRNFFAVLRCVLDRDIHLFHPEELQLTQLFDEMPEPVQRLYIRLFNRRGPYFRLEQLRYAEIPELPLAAAYLQHEGLASLWSSWLTMPSPAASEASLDTSPDAPPVMVSALDAFTVAELTPLARSLGYRPGNRTALLEILLTADSSEMFSRLLAIGSLIQLRHRSLFERIQHLFFLSGFHDASTMVVADLELTRYPTYRIWRSRPIFLHRPAFEQYLEALALRDNFYLSLQQNDGPRAALLGAQLLEKFRQTPAPPDDFLARFSAQRVYARACLEFVRRLEPGLASNKVAELFEDLLERGLPPHLRGETFDRLALHLERVGEREKARRVCRAGLDEGSTRGGARVALELRLARLEQQETPSEARAKGGRPSSRADRSASQSAAPGKVAATPLVEVKLYASIVQQKHGKKALFVGAAGAVVEVETLALDAYRSAGFVGIHSENGLFSTLAMLFFWDIVFGDVPDVFQHPYQDAPLDLYSDEFFDRRRDKLEMRLAELEEGRFDSLTLHYQKHFMFNARGVLWENFPFPILMAGSAALGGPALSGILRFLLEDFQTRRRGMPDLLLWQDPEASNHAAAESYWGKAGYQAQAPAFFAEVKSPRDRLSPEQRAWIALFQQLGIHVEVCKVEARAGASLSGAE